MGPGSGTAAGEVAGAPGESWKAINYALAIGVRGLPGDSSLAELLAGVARLHVELQRAVGRVDLPVRAVGPPERGPDRVERYEVVAAYGPGFVELVTA